MIANAGAQLSLAYAFVEREIALSKRYWAWEIVWLVYGIVTSLSVAYIGLAAPAITGGSADPAQVCGVGRVQVIGRQIGDNAVHPVLRVRGGLLKADLGPAEAEHADLHVRLTELPLFHDGPPG